MNKILVYWVTCVLTLAASVASATTIVLPTDEQLIAKSPVIVEGTVVSSVPVDRDGTIWTETQLAVSRAIRGEAAGTILIEEIGGMIVDANGEGRVTRIYGAPEFEAGEKVLLFLEPSPRGGFRTIDLYVGKFSRAETTDGRRLWLRDDTTEDVNLLDEEFQPIPRRNVQRDAGRFENFISERLAGRAGVRNYGIENPLLARATREGDRRDVISNFTLIAEPTIYRWGAFDNGGSASWYSGGTQPGYSGGGVNELKTAISSWVDYSGGAKIRYVYSGTAKEPYGGLGNTRNGVNEVLFNDPLNQISGSWNPATGGVVGQGGFNGAMNASSPWTAPFTADASHTAGPKSWVNITEGNLVIQDGVSPNAGIGSNTLAEIVAHEFGHTLGFGHSADKTALMYASVSGLGPSLRNDDKVAATWLYPGSGTTPPPTPTVPAAPTGLSATVSSSNADLRWTDNASNETSQTIWVATATGSFAKVGTVDANVTSARVSGLAAGSYRAYVIAANSAGNSAQSNTTTFTVASTLTPGFSFTPQSGTAGVTTFTFYDESKGTVTARSWNFGDGTTSTAAIATHVYAQPGSYTVTLSISGGGNSAQVSKSLTVSGTINAAFNVTPANPTTNDTVQFLDASSGGPTSWLWNFGDGSSSTQQNPSKRFAAPGGYTISLTVSRGGVSSTTTKSLTVSSTAPTVPAVTAAFDMSTATATPGQSVSFTDRSSGSPTSWSWSFGDGTTSTSRNPSKSWGAAGTYTVTLTASNASGSSSASKQVVVSPLATFRSLVSVSAQTGGVGGTSWKTELTIFNAGSQGANITLTFIPGAGSSVLTRTSYLGAMQSRTYENALYDVFGLSTGSGAIAVDANGSSATPQLRVNSRTYTTGTKGTYGQSVPEVEPSTLESTIYLTGIQANAAFRTNLGLVNRSAATVTASLTLYSSNGSALATADVTVPGNNFQQAALNAFFPQISGASYDALSVRVAASASDALSAYASVVDNKSQDPIYIQAMPGATGGSAIIPVVGRAEGVNGTFWRSDVALFNPTSSRMQLTLRYGTQSRSVTLDARRTELIADVLQSRFGLSGGSGMLQLSWGSATGPVVSSRTYTSVEGGGTYGQSIDAVASLGASVYVPGLRNDASYRTNVGFVNGGNESESFVVTVLSPAGAEVGRTTLTLAPGQQSQYAVATLFPSLGNASGSFTLRLAGDSNAKLFAYGSMVDNRSGDPVFFAGR